MEILTLRHNLASCFFFLSKKRLTSMLNVEIQLNLYVYTSYVDCEAFSRFIENLTDRQQVLYSLPRS